MLDLLPSNRKPIGVFYRKLLLAHLVVFLMCLVMAGCGGGYAGGVVPSLTTSKVTIDSGQSFMAVATNPSNLPLTWSLSGAACSGQTCGTLSDTSALGATYVAPSVTQQVTVTLTSTVTGTQASSTTTIVVNPAPQISGSAPDATVGTAYSATFALTGGTPTVKWLAVKGTLPAGLSFNTTTGILSGTPTTAGSSSFTLQAVDSSDVPFTVTSVVTLKVNAGAGNSALKATGTTPDGTVNVPYVSVLQASGGTSPYTWSVTSGTLPAGLSLSGAGVLSGTPTAAGISTFTVQVKDAANATATLNLTLKINSASSGGSLTIATSTLPDGTVQVPYSASIAITGGTTPYTCSVDSGSLPVGLTLGSNCAVTGIPTTAGTSTFTVHATDASNPSVSGTGLITIVIHPASAVLVVASPPTATLGVPYSGAIPVTGGTAPYHCVLVAGTMPAGLTLGANCVISGTPLATGTTSVSVTVTDSANPPNTKTAPITITVQGTLITLTLTAPPVGVVNVPYIGVIAVLGGTPPYTCSVHSGTLPPGITLHSDCTLTGTPTSAGAFSVDVAVHDSASPVNSNVAPVPITILGATSSLTLTGPADATVNTPYSGAIGVTGGTAPYTCVKNSGSLPAGLTMAANCAITGTPTAVGTSTFNVTATDSANPAKTGTANIVMTVNPISPLSLTGGLPNAILGVAYTQTLHATGGLPPYTYTLTSGSLPAGLSLSSSGVVSGTPTAVGASSFTITATDSQTTPQQASDAITMQVVYPTTPYDALLKGPYAFLFQGYDDVVAGVLAYQTATVGSITADGNGLLTDGELDSNHQSSNPTGNTIATSNLLGTYTIGQDGRGTLAVTTMNADGTAGNTALYALALKLPTAPATAASSGSMIESDGNILVASKGSGTLLAQNTTAYSNGLTGNYAFGVSGDTPCIPTCTIGLIAGPVATVGQFNVSGGTITGVSDANIASTNYASSTLTGSSSAADTNGRIGLTLNSAKLAGLAYPTHYAVYLVDATHAFLMSTDKHSSYVLQAGTATAQSTSTFSNASLNGPFVGYENAAINPGIIGKALDSVLNLSSANVIRGTGNNNGTCTTTNADSAGLTGLVNTLTGLGGNIDLLKYVLGNYQSLGNSSCAVTSNGRVVFNYPAPDPSLLTPILQWLGLTGNPPAPRVVYLTGNNAGYFLETGYAGLGHLEAQAAGPFTLANLNGTYTYGTVPASSLATINSDGTFTADGAGNLTYTTDTNVGVGNLNILQLGVGGNANYSVTDATGGRYLLNDGTIIYALSPGRFVVLKGGLLSTAPYTAILY